MNIQWTLPEYERERTRRLIRAMESKSQSIGMISSLPIDSHIITTVEWIEEQERTHNKWLKERINNPTKEEHTWAVEKHEYGGSSKLYAFVVGYEFAGYRDRIKRQQTSMDAGDEDYYATNVLEPLVSTTIFK